MKVHEGLSKVSAYGATVVVYSDKGYTPEAHEEVSSNSAKNLAVTWAGKSGVASPAFDFRHNKVFLDQDLNPCSKDLSLQELSQQAKYVAAEYNIYRR